MLPRRMRCFLPGKPKILRTLDYGPAGKIYPDSVKEYKYKWLSRCDGVQPDRASVFRDHVAGTEIGLFESLDDGLSWHYADNACLRSRYGRCICGSATHSGDAWPGIWTLDLTLVGMQEKMFPEELYCRVTRIPP